MCVSILADALQPFTDKPLESAKGPTAAYKAGTGQDCSAETEAAA